MRKVHSLFCHPYILSQWVIMCERGKQTNSWSTASDEFTYCMVLMHLLSMPEQKYIKCNQITALKTDWKWSMNVRDRS